MRNILLTAAVLAAGLAGCVGGIDAGSGGGDDGTGSGGTVTPPGGTGGSGSGSGSAGTGSAQSKALFDANVYPVLAAKCKGCHTAAAPLTGAPGFVAADLSTGYDTARGYVSLVGNLTVTAPILALPLAGHNGTSYTADETTKITAWLAAELNARNGGDPPVENAATKLQKQWSGCMTQANFTTANMVAWANMNTNDNGNGNANCQSCHDNAEYSQIATNVSAKFFTGISTQSALMSQYFTFDSVTAPTMIIINQTNLTAVATAATPHIGHRRFNLANSAGMTALTSFYNLTAASLAAGTCGASTLAN